MKKIIFYFVLPSILFACTPPPAPEPPKTSLKWENSRKFLSWVQRIKRKIVNGLRISNSEYKLKDLAAQDTKQKEIVVEQKEKVTAKELPLKRKSTKFKNRAQKKPKRFLKNKLLARWRKIQKFQRWDQNIDCKASKGVGSWWIERFVNKESGNKWRRSWKDYIWGKSKGEDVKRYCLQKFWKKQQRFLMRKWSRSLKRFRKWLQKQLCLLKSMPPQQRWKILEDAGDISEAITRIVEKNEEMLEEEKSFLRETMAKLTHACSVSEIKCWRGILLQHWRIAGSFTDRTNLFRDK